MLTSIKERLDREDEGFTLIELMVVVLIIAILLAIAIPTFLGARGQANSRAAQSSLRNALTAEQTYYTNNQAFQDTAAADVASISAIEPNLTWVSAESAAPAPNSVYAEITTNSTTGDTVFLQTYAKDGNCYTVYQTNGSVPAGNFGTGYNVEKGPCQAPAALTAGTPLTVAANSASKNAGTTEPPPAAAFYNTW